MTQKKQLISTCLSPKIKKKKDKIFLGSWCFEEISNLNKKSFIKNRWEKTKLIREDYKYLKNLFGRIINKIPDYLNDYHKTDYPSKFWKYLIWIWINHYLVSLYFRWKTVEQAIKNNKNIDYYYAINEDKMCVNKTYEFIYFVANSNYYNEYLFSKIIKKFNHKINLFEIKPHQKNKDKFYRIYKISSKDKAIRTINNFLSKYFFTKPNFIVTGGFSLKNLFILSLKKFKLPFFIDDQFRNSYKMELFKLSKNKVNKRKEIKFKFEPKNSFEKFVSNNLVFDIPSFYIENFFTEINVLKKIKINPKLIISSDLHMDNDRYRLWLLMKKFFDKSNITLVEHGGNHTDLSWDYNSEREISTKYFSWHKKDNKQKFPVPRYIGLKSKKNIEKNILYVGYENFKYPFRLGRGPKSLENLESISNLKFFSENLKYKIYRNLYYSEKHFFDKRNYEEIKKIIGKEKIKKRGSFKQELTRSKLLICDYPQTTFFECILAGPTILVSNYIKNWKPQKNFESMYLDLKKNQIIFDDVNSATKFINNNWDNIDEWWNSKNINLAKTRLLRNFNINTSSGGLQKWVDYINLNLKL